MILSKGIHFQEECEYLARYGAVVDYRDADQLGVFVDLKSFKPDLYELVNPPYRDFCRGALTGYVRDHYLSLCNLEGEGYVNVSLRYHPEKYSYLLMLKGISELLPYMERNNLGCVRVGIGERYCINTVSERKNLIIIDYGPMIIEPDTCITYIEVSLTVREPFRGKFVTVEERITTLKFEGINSALLHLIAGRYRSFNWYNNLFLLPKKLWTSKEFDAKDD